MAHKADVSGSLAVTPQPRKDARQAPRNVGNRQSPYPTRALDPAQPAEVAQARVFERLLQTERVELQGLARVIDELPDSEGADPTQDLVQIRARLDEIHDLLRALQGRFPHGMPDPPASYRE